MLNAFLKSGQMDLMHWSQPTYLGVLPYALPLHILGNDPSYALSGVLASITTFVALSILTSRSGDYRAATLLPLTLFAFPEFVHTAVTAMSDQYFLAYLTASLILLSADGRTTSKYQMVGLAACFGLAALTRAHALILPLCALVGCGWNQSKSERTSLIVLFCVVPVTFVLATMLTTNRIPLTEITSILPILHGELALFDVRAMILAIFDTAFALLPASMWLANKHKLGKPDFIVTAVAFLLALNSFIKGHAITSVCDLPNALTLVLIPVACGLLTNVLRNGPIDNRMYRTSLLFAAGTIVVMPIMPHPMSRHALPALVSILFALAIGRPRAQFTRSFFIAAAGLSLMIGNNLISNYTQRVSLQKDWDASIDGVKKGIPASKIYAGWNWFCFNQLKPGQIEDYDYQKEYLKQKELAPYVVSNGVLKPKTIGKTSSD